MEKLDLSKYKKTSAEIKAMSKEEANAILMELDDLKTKFREETSKELTEYYNKVFSKLEYYKKVDAYACDDNSVILIQPNDSWQMIEVYTNLIYKMNGRKDIDTDVFIDVTRGSRTISLVDTKKSADDTFYVGMTNLFLTDKELKKKTIEYATEIFTTFFEFRILIRSYQQRKMFN